MRLPLGITILAIIVSLLSLAGFAFVFGAVFAKPSPARVPTLAAGLIICVTGIALVRALWTLSSSASAMLAFWGVFTIVAALGLPVLAAPRRSAGVAVMSALIALVLTLLTVWPSARYVAHYTRGPA